MFCYLTTFSLIFGQVGDDDIRTKVPAKPFECAHSRSFRFDETGRRLIGVTQRGELLVWKDNPESPVVTVLEEKAGGSLFDRAPMSAVLTAGGTEVALFYLDGRIQVWNIDTGMKVKDLESDRRDLGYAHLSPDGEVVACLSYGREGNPSAILFWKTRDWTSAGKIESIERINDFCFRADG